MARQTPKAKSFVLFVVSLAIAVCTSPGISVTDPAGAIAARYAADQAAVAPQPGWTHYTNANKVLDLAFDQVGDLWVATTGGVVRWDTSQGTYKKYTTADGLVDNFVASVAVAPDGSLWFGTFDGISSLSGTTWASHFAYGFDASGGVPVAVAPDGSLWFLNEDSIARFDGSAPRQSDRATGWETYPTAHGPTGRTTLSLVVASDGTVWFARGYSGVSRLTCVGRGEGPDLALASAGAKFPWTTYRANDGLADDAVISIAEAPDGALWFGTWEDGVSRHSGGAWATFTTADGLAGDRVQAIAAAPDGTLWFGTDGGVSRYTGLVPGAAAGQDWTTFTTADGLAHNSVRSIAIGPDGSPWFGTWGGGVSRLTDPQASQGDRAAWTTYATDDVLTGNSIQSVSAAPDGALWFGTWGGGVSRYADGRWTTYTSADGLVSNFVYATAVARDGTLWVGTEGGVSRFTGSADSGLAWTTYTPADGLADSDVLAIAVAPDGALWFGTWGGGVSRFAVPRPGASADDRSDWTTYTVADGLVDNRVQSIAIAPDGTVWIGTWGGISCLRGSTWTTYTTADGLADDRVNALALAPDGTLWAGTEDGVSHYGGTAVSRVDGRAWTTYTTADGLVDDGVKAIAATDDGTLWFGTRIGVSRFVPSVHQAVNTGAVPASNTGLRASAWTTFTMDEGLPDGHIPSIAVASDGAPWFGSWHGGIARYLPPS